jgi:adenosylcobinamide-phosphate synthase
MDMILIMPIALTVDLVLGDPPNTWHPVAWLGKLISLETKWALQRGKPTELFFGIIVVLLTVGAVTTATIFLLLYLRGLYWPLYLIIAGLLLKSTFSLRGLRKAMVEVKGFLAKDEIAHARTSLKALVSRDTANLNESQIVSATVESAAENACDSFVAPLFYFLLFGVPGAVAYRVINTFDAMIGYRGAWEHLGKFAARLDDVINFIPARISALIIVLAARICKRDMSGSWQVMLRDHGRTQSPNAGWTMSAIAGALGVQLEKVGHYKLGDNHHALSVNMIDGSEKIIMVVAIIWSFLIILAGVIYFVIA